METSRTEMKGLVLPVPSNQIKNYYYFTLQRYIYDFFLLHIEIEGKCRWIIRGGGGSKGMLPPSQIIGGPGPAGPPLPTPLHPSDPQVSQYVVSVQSSSALFTLDWFVCCVVSLMGQETIMRTKCFETLQKQRARVWIQ